jgi:hypothetical protein
MTDDLVKQLWESDAASALTNRAARRIEELETKMAKAMEALDSIELYGSDTLSGRTDGPADAKWHREGVKEMRDRARATLAELKGQDDE